MFIVWWRTYRYGLPVRTHKIVDCEQCGERYVYSLERTVSGEGASIYFADDQGAQRRARSRARAKIDSVLERACDPVPCPRCGRYQKSMVARYRKLFARWMNKAGLCFLVVGLVFGAVGNLLSSYLNRGGGEGLTIALQTCQILFLVSLLLAASFPLLRLILARTSDPNRKPAEERIALGRERAVTAREYAERQASQIELEL